MNDREKILAAAVAALVALWGMSQGWEKYQTALERNLNAQHAVAQQLSTARTATARGRRAQQKLRQWQRQSLPTNPDIAVSLYQDWLQQQLTAAGLKVKELNIRSPRTSSPDQRQHTLVVSATGKLAELTDFLYRFYHAKHLHRISKAKLTPTDDRSVLKISLTVDALSLAGCKRPDELADGTNDSFQHALDSLRNNIVSRNLFATYQTAKPQPTEIADAEDAEAAQANFSGINYGQDGWQMSVRMKNTGKVFYYREGDTIEIGQFKGTIEKLDGNRRRAIVASEAGRQQIRLGQTLAEAEPLGDEAS